MKTRIAVALTLAVALATAALPGCGHEEPPVPAASAGTQRYQCAMHPQIVSDRPGTCPICGMRLTPVEEAAPPAVGDVPGRAGEVTELDVSIYSGSFPGPVVDYFDIPSNLLVQQGYRYRTFFAAFKELQGKISSVTFWGKADDHTWLASAGRTNAPLLFDQSLKKKHAYWGVVDPLQLPGADLVTSVVADSPTVEAGQAVSYTLAVSPATGSELVKTGLATSAHTLAAGDALAEAGNPHDWMVTATDAAGNTRTTTTRGYTVDETPPASFALGERFDATTNARSRTPGAASLVRTFRSRASSSGSLYRSATDAIEGTSSGAAVSSLSRT